MSDERKIRYCSNCGAKLSEDAKFCSNCGKAVLPDPEAETTTEESDNVNSGTPQNDDEKIIEGTPDINDTEPIDVSYTDITESDASESPSKSVPERNNETDKSSTPHINESIKNGEKKADKNTEIKEQLKATSDNIKEKISTFWNNFGDPNKKRLYVIVLTVLIIMLIIAILLRVADNRSSAGSSNSRGASAESTVPRPTADTSMYGPDDEYDWSHIVLRDLLPEPESSYGKISTNSETKLSLYVYAYTEYQYYDYIELCKEKGFTFDTEQTDSKYSAFDAENNGLSLTYSSGKEEMDISLTPAKQYGRLFWPESGLAVILPVPEVTRGEIEQNNTSNFTVHLSEFPIESYQEYVDMCVDSGFIYDLSETAKSYTAKNAEGYILTVTYEGGKVVSIILDVPQYAVSIEVNCETNLLLNKYDVTFLIDDKTIGNIDHGSQKIFDLELSSGIHQLEFRSRQSSKVNGFTSIDVQGEGSIKFKITCYSSSIGIKIQEGAEAAVIGGSADAKADDTGNGVQVIEEKPEEETEGETTEEIPEMTAQSADAVSYSTNDKDTVKDGNTGVYAYAQSGNTYNMYWIIDFDEGYAYSFSSADYDAICERVKIVSGDLNDYVLVTFHDGDEVWSYGLHFEWQRQPDHLIEQNEDGLEVDFYTTNLDDALKLRDTKTIKDY